MNQDKQSNTNPSSRKTLIFLSGQPPVRINVNDWPVIATGITWFGDHQDPSRTWTVEVREHKDGRTLISGEFESRWMGEETQRVGRRLSAMNRENLVKAIRDVCGELSGDPEERLYQRVVQNLPPVELM